MAKRRKRVVYLRLTEEEAYALQEIGCEGVNQRLVDAENEEDEQLEEEARVADRVLVRLGDLIEKTWEREEVTHKWYADEWNPNGG